MILESPAKILAHYLVSVGAGTWTGAWPITWSKLPDDPPKRRIAFFDTGKILLPAYQRLTGVAVGTPQKSLVQMRIRTEETGYDEGYKKGEQIAGRQGVFDLMKDVVVTVNAVQYLIGSARVYIAFTPIGQEPPPSTTKNWHFTANVRLHFSGG